MSRARRPGATSTHAFDLAALATSAELLGAGERVLADSVAYVKQRKQFGREIGSYQAIKHQLADVRIALDFARPLVFGAAVDPTPRSVSAAKIQSADAADLAARVGLQVHGAIGYTAEYDLSRWLLRIRALQSAWGTPAFHRERLLTDLLDAPMTDLVPTREHTELASSVRNLLDKRSDSQAVRHAIEQPAGFDTDLWATLCEQIGVAALAIPEEHGGAGFTLAETHVVLEELGRTLTPSPLLASVVASAALLAAEHHEPLARIAEGAVATVAWSGVTGAADARVGVTWKDGVLHGSVSPVLYGDAAEILLVAAAHDGVGLFSGRPGRHRPDPHARGRHGPDSRLRRTRLRRRRTPSRSPWTPRRPCTTAHRVGTLATAALAVGCAQRGLDMTVEYTKQREQFGRPIGSFQALKHRMADMLVQRADVPRRRLGRRPGPRRRRTQRRPPGRRRGVVLRRVGHGRRGRDDPAARRHRDHLGARRSPVFKRAQALHQLFGLPHQAAGEAHLTRSLLRPAVALPAAPCGATGSRSRPSRPRRVRSRRARSAPLGAGRSSSSRARSP